MEQGSKTTVWSSLLLSYLSLKLSQDLKMTREVNSIKKKHKCLHLAINYPFLEKAISFHLSQKLLTIIRSASISRRRSRQSTLPGSLNCVATAAQWSPDCQNLSLETFKFWENQIDEQNTETCQSRQLLLGKVLCLCSLGFGDGDDANSRHWFI